MKSKRNIFLIGPMGAGKTTIGRQLALLMNLEFFDSDAEVETKAGVAIDWIWDVEGEQGFRRREMQTIDELSQRQGIVLATGGGAVTTPDNRKHLAGRGTVVYLKASVEQQVRRTRKDKKRPLIQNPDPEKKLGELMSQREQWYEEIADFVISTDGSNIKSIANSIFRSVSE